MALIRYHIQVNAGGAVQVFQDILQINVPDGIIFTGLVVNSSDLPAGEAIAIQYTSHCPFNGASDPKDGVPFLIKGRGTTHTVKRGNKAEGEQRPVPGFGNRKTFHFVCGHAKTSDPTTTFTPWGGIGGTGAADTPTGGDDNG